MTARPRGHVPAPRAPELTSESGADVGALTERLQVLRSNRIADDREGDQITSVLRAITLPRRSRDAGVSKGLREHRTHLEQAWADAEDMVMAATEVALLVHLRGGDDPVT